MIYLDVMKRRIISPVCSAFIVPGLGQVINNQIKKGLILFFSVFALIGAAVFEIYRLVKKSLEGLALNELYPERVIEEFKAQDHTVLYLIGILFSAVWIYSVLDAYIVGKRIDQEKKDEVIFDR